MIICTLSNVVSVSTAFYGIVNVIASIDGRSRWLSTSFLPWSLPQKMNDSGASSLDAMS